MEKVLERIKVDNNIKLYTNSENSNAWIIKNLDFTDLS